MKYILFSLSLLWVGCLAAQDRSIEIDKVITTQHQTVIKGQKITFQATTGTQPMWDEAGKTIAAVHYTYYERTDIDRKPMRPLVISFNGGPGSGSVWMHLAYTGPSILKIDDEGFPVQPYGIKTNPYSILDVADIVFVNPINTGFSRITDPEAKRETFFGVNADIKYLAEWLNTFVSRANRWESPKYLIGESYGTTRVSGLALELQERQWMYLNGVILVSPTDIGIDRSGPVDAANELPYFAATAWYHGKLPPDLQEKDLDEILPEVEAYTLNKLIPTLAKGGFVSAEDKESVAQQMARYSGLSKQSVLDHNLAVPAPFFWKELLRSEGHTVGRLDSRYKGIDRINAGTRPDYNSELTSWLHSFTPAVNYYYKNVLNYQTDLKYNMFGPVHPWDRSNNQTGENLRKAMAENPYLNVMIQSGFYDGATQYFDAKYTMWQIDPSGQLKDRFRFKGYRSGHMMYLRKEDLIKANDDIRDFIKQSTPAAGQSAKY